MRMEWQNSKVEGAGCEGLLISFHLLLDGAGQQHTLVVTQIVPTKTRSDTMACDPAKENQRHCSTTATTPPQAAAQHTPTQPSPALAYISEDRQLAKRPLTPDAMYLRRV